MLLIYRNMKQTFWVQRNLKAIEYIDQKPIRRFFVSNNPNAFLIE